MEENEVKKCTQCGGVYTIDNFYRNGKRLAVHCKECHKRNIKEKYDERIKEIIDYKSSIGCQKCGEKRGYVLEFHHKDPTIKEYQISNHARTPLKNMMDEVKKCVILCSNCHKEFHWFLNKENITIEEYLESKP